MIVYLDTSALVKLYISEPESSWLDRALRGRRDLIVSDRQCPSQKLRVSTL